VNFQRRTKSVLITGASSGIGQAAAHLFAESNWRVWAGVRNKDDYFRLQQVIGIEPLMLDVRSEEQVALAVEQISQSHEACDLDVLVANAGIVKAGPIEFASIEDWREQFETNVYGVVRLLRASMPLMRRASDPRIIIIGSINSRIGMPLLGPYAASKHALSGLADSFRRELGSDGPKVSVIEPGAVDTPLWGKASEMAASMVASMSLEGMGRYGDAIAEQQRKLDRHKNQVCSPEVVAKKIILCAASSKPPAHLLVGKDARLAWAMQSLLPSRLFDWIIRARTKSN
jgi:NAD(P)-dependent dehydrogenase (short-subunit alcohol dehydrogenase family)